MTQNYLFCPLMERSKDCDLKSQHRNLSNVEDPPSMTANLLGTAGIEATSWITYNLPQGWGVAATVVSLPLLTCLLSEEDP